MELLPNEVLTIILKHVGPDWMPIMKRVCRKWRLIVHGIFPLSTKPRLDLYAENMGLVTFALSLGAQESELFRHALERGSLDVVQYFCSTKSAPLLKRNALSFASASGHILIVKYLRSVNCQWDVHTCSETARNGHLDCLIYAREHKCPWNRWTCAFAALHGHLECLKYAHEGNGNELFVPCPWDEWTCANAALNGHLNCLQYAREHGCPWDEWACANAAQNGHLNCLQYAREHGCPA